MLCFHPQSLELWTIVCVIMWYDTIPNTKHLKLWSKDIYIRNHNSFFLVLIFNMVHYSPELEDMHNGRSPLDVRDGRCKGTRLNKPHFARRLCLLHSLCKRQCVHSKGDLVIRMT